MKSLESFNVHIDESSSQFSWTTHSPDYSITRSVYTLILIRFLTLLVQNLNIYSAQNLPHYFSSSTCYCKRNIHLLSSTCLWGVDPQSSFTVLPLVAEWSHHFKSTLPKCYTSPARSISWSSGVDCTHHSSPILILSQVCRVVSSF